MPLPDERPRQSVANLIGRFEQQNKRQPSSPGSTAASLPRTTSVASQISGDSAKEEAKEKREWPPKSSTTNDKPALTPSSSWTSAKATSTPQSQPASPPSGEAISPSAAPVSDPISPPALSIPAPKAPPAQRQSSTGLKTTPAATARNPTSPVKVPAPRTSVAGANISRAAAKSPVKSPPKSSALSASHSQPIKPQHTGQSTASTPSTTRHIKSTPRTAPSTPSRPKTPGSTRPKTPSSGLFAPTAASLARSRSQQPAVPTPTKKATLSASASDRLSKPTAASMSKVRSPVPAVASPARGPKASSAPATRGGVSGRGKTMKPRVGLAGARIKQETAKSGSGNGAPAAVVTVSQAEDHGDVEHNQNGHDDQGVPEIELQDHIDDVHEEIPAEHEELPQEEVLEEELAESIPHDAEPEPHAEEEYDSAADAAIPPARASPEAVVEEPVAEGTVPEPESHDPASDLHHANADVEEAPVSHSEAEAVLIDREDEVKPHVSTGDDIEAMVSLLEPRRVSVASIPDIAGEIPDEE